MTRFIKVVVITIVTKPWRDTMNIKKLLLVKIREEPVEAIQWEEHILEVWQ